MNPDDIGYLGVRDLTALYRSRKLSPVEVLKAILARIERIEPRVNAMMRLTPEIALAAAKRSETAFMQREKTRLLEGIPFTIKDLQHTKGVQTDFASAVMQGTIPDVDAPCVSRLYAAGGMMLGKTSSAAEWG
ncbi:MAG: amidase family protein, partial [Alphaproteobacteria bacterium]